MPRNTVSHSISAGYPSTAHPTLAQKPVPSQPLPPHLGQSENLSASATKSGRRRSSVMISITTWAEDVPPGSPAPPCPPSHHTGSTSDLPGNCKQALKAAGYPSSIVNLQDVILPPPAPLKKSRYSLIPEPRPSDKSHRDLKRSTSRSSLKGEAASQQKQQQHSRSRSAAVSRHPPTANHPPPEMPELPPSSSSKDRSLPSASKDKKAKYHTQPPLSRDLALSQFMDGGSTEDVIRRYVQAQAKASGAPKVNGQYVGAGDVYRDERGGIWRDREEELERAHLLADRPREKSWVGFGKDLAAADEEYRRGSVSTDDSDLDPRYAVQPNDEEILKLGGAVPPHMHTRRSGRHLHKSDSLLNLFPAPPDSQSPNAVSTSTVVPDAKGKERRKPTPLPIDNSQVKPAFVYSPVNPAFQEEGRRDFMESSFVSHPQDPVRPSRAGSIATMTTVGSDSKSSSKFGKSILKAVGMKK